MAKLAGVSVASVYNCERYDRGGRLQTLVKLAKALGLKLRLPDLPSLATDLCMTETKLAEAAGLAFGTVRKLLDSFPNARQRAVIGEAVFSL